MPITRPTTITPEVLERLEDIARQFREQNPHIEPQRIFVDGCTVWLREPERGKDFGYYSVCLDDKIVYCVNAEGQTVIHRDIPVADVPAGT